MEHMARQHQTLTPMGDEYPTLIERWVMYDGPSTFSKAKSAQGLEYYIAKDLERLAASYPRVRWGDPITLDHYLLHNEQGGKLHRKLCGTWARNGLGPRHVSFETQQSGFEGYWLLHDLGLGFAAWVDPGLMEIILRAYRQDHQGVFYNGECPSATSAMPTLPNLESVKQISQSLWFLADGLEKTNGQVKLVNQRVDGVENRVDKMQDRVNRIYGPAPTHKSIRLYVTENLRINPTTGDKQIWGTKLCAKRDRETPGWRGNCEWHLWDPTAGMKVWFHPVDILRAFFNGLGMREPLS